MTAFLTWRDDLLMGIDVLDADHQQMVMLLNLLYDPRRLHPIATQRRPDRCRPASGIRTRLANACVVP